MIHPTSVIDKSAHIPDSVEIGPYCTVKGNVKFGEGCVVHSHCCFEGNTVIGNNNTFFPFSTIGYAPPDKKYKGDESFLYIGDNNIFRELMTVHRGTAITEKEKTTIGNNNLFLAESHIGHDVTIENNVVLSHGVKLGGHAHIKNYVTLSGRSSSIQKCVIGEYSYVSALTLVVAHCPPFSYVDGMRGKIKGVNIVGLRRNGFSNVKIKEIMSAYTDIFNNKSNDSLVNYVRNYRSSLSNVEQNDSVSNLLDFLEGYSPLSQYAGK